MSLFFARLDFRKFHFVCFVFRVLLNVVFFCVEKKKSIITKKQSMMMQRAQQQYHHQRFAHACARNEKKNTARCVLFVFVILGLFLFSKLVSLSFFSLFFD